MSEPKKLSELSIIKEEDVKDALISGLRSRPNAKSIYGAKGLTAEELKKQYDKYPEILRARLNELVKTIKESLDNADENGSKIAEEIMVVVQGFTTGARTDNLAHAIEEMIERILGAEAVADEAKAGAESAEAVAQNAVSTANSAESKANSAGNLASGANANASEAKETANEAKSKAVNAEENATAAVESADYARTVAEEAIGVARTAEGIADQAIGISKGANQAEVFDTVGQMNEWIEKRKKEVDYADLEGKTLPAGTTLIYSAADNSKGHSIESASLVAIFSLNGEDIFYFDQTATSVKQGRAFFTYTLQRDTTIESISASLFYYNGVDSADCYKNPRWTYVEGSIGDINYDYIKSHNIAVGTNLYIRDIGVPDYWWDGSKVQQLETQKVDLAEYADKDFVAQNYVAKITNNTSGLYVHDYMPGVGWVDKVIGYASTINAKAWTFVQRDGSARIIVLDPTDDYHAANKHFVRTYVFASANIKNGAVTTDKIAQEAVGTSKIKDGAVTLEKLANEVKTIINDYGARIAALEAN